MPATVAVAAGILLDRAFELSPAIWLGAAVVALIVTVACWNRSRTASSIAVMMALGCAGGLRHWTAWSAREPDDIAAIVEANDVPVRIVGVVESGIEIVPARTSPRIPSWQLTDRSTGVLRCERLGPAGDSVPATGRVRFDVSGHVLQAGIGDRVEIVGRLRIPAPPRSPRDFDFRNWLRAQGIDRVLAVDHPEGVQVIGPAGRLRDRVARWRHELREHCQRVLSDVLSEEARGVGGSLLLGTRTGLTDEVRQAFIDSGTMHLLAISGLHVAILAWCVSVGCRLFNLSIPATAIVIIATLATYTIVTDLRPPVLRSTVLGCLVAAAVPGARRGSGFNLLAATAFLLLLWNPCDLFDVGAQLSFLAVAAILWSTRLIARLPQRGDPLLLDSDLSPAVRMGSRAWVAIRDCYIVTGAIWLFTLPLTMAWFHFISPVGFLLNVVLLPFSLPLLASGFLTLALGLLWPPLAVIPGAVYELCLRALLAIVDWSAAMPWGHWSLPGPSNAWLIAFYSVLTGAIVLPSLEMRRWAWRLLGVGCAVTVVGSLLPARREGLACTFIDVGHGGAIVLELPGGRTLLFDAGTFGPPDRARNRIQDVLWGRGVRRLDGIVLSHADVDHFNAATDVMDDFPTGCLLCPQEFLDFEQPAVRDLCESAAVRGVPIEIVQAGDELVLDRDTTIRVLHPQGVFEDELDNAHSAVLLVQYADRSLVLTGDVERAGLVELLEQPAPGRIDLLQAPHHGGASANTSDLARWAAAKIVIASNGPTNAAAVQSRLEAVYPDAEEVLTTATSGSVTVTISPRGEVAVTRQVAATDAP